VKGLTSTVILGFDFSAKRAAPAMLANLALQFSKGFDGSAAGGAALFSIGLATLIVLASAPELAILRVVVLLTHYDDQL